MGLGRRLLMVLGGVAAVTVVFGYFSYCVGTARVLAQLHAVPLEPRSAPRAVKRRR